MTEQCHDCYSSYLPRAVHPKCDESVFIVTHIASSAMQLSVELE
jgi:hypothetical protein